MPERLCLAVENDEEPISWGCNAVVDHDPPHTFTFLNSVHHEWVD